MNDFKPTNAILYLRYSPRPNPAESLSLDTQRDRCAALCKQRKLKILDTYEDAATSAATDDRPGFQRAVAAACRAKACLVVYAISRFARSTKDCLQYAEILNTAGAHLVSVTEPIDTTTASGTLTFSILAALSQFERELTAERTSDAMLRHQAAGRRMSHHVPYGWSVDPDNQALMVKNPREQKIGKWIAQAHQGGMSYRKIAKQLTDKGVEPRSRTWSHVTVSRIAKRFEASEPSELSESSESSEPVEPSEPPESSEPAPNTTHSDSDSAAAQADS